MKALQRLGETRRCKVASTATGAPIGPAGRAAFAQAGQARGDHAGVVEHQGVAGAQEIGQLAHHVVGERLARADDQQARGVARLGRAQGDTVFGKVEIEVRKAHGRASSARWAHDVKRQAILVPSLEIDRQP
jgi:hypothetical protein